MKYLNLSIEKYAYLCAVALMLVCSSISDVYSQTGPCALACNGTTQVSLNSSCDALITPNMILSDNGSSCMGGTLSVVVSDDYGPIPTGDLVSNEYMGQTLEAMVIDGDSGNSCWGYIIIEDKLGPNITDCPMGFITMDCADMNTYEGPIFTDNCEGELTSVLLSEEVDAPCTPGIIKIINRVYSAKDSKGNLAVNSCSVRLRLRRFNPSRVTFPDSLTTEKGNAVSCSAANEYDVNGNGRIDEGELTAVDFGVPSYLFFTPSGEKMTIELFPYPDVFCNTVVTMTDIVLPKIGCTQKIMRRFRINDWHCTGEIDTTYTQIIEITDQEGPVLACEPVLQLTTNTLIAQPGGTYGDFNCGATVNLPLPTASDNCSSELEYDISYNTGFVDDYKGESITLPMGTNVVLYTVYDDCYNSSTCHIAVDIVDKTPPVSICDQNTVVSLTNGGTAVVNAESFNDGSYDDCKLHCSLVRRMDNGTCECRVPEFCDLTYVGKYNGSNYYLSNYKISSGIAKSRAAGYGGGLVIFNSLEEEEWVVNNVRTKHSESFWIGLKAHGDSFLWDDHTPLSYNNFSPVSIIDSDAGCVLVGEDNYWTATSCVSTLASPNEWRYVLEVPDGCGFSSGVQFCCDDANNDHMVVLRVVDFYGNYNDCMVNLTVQDKAAPRLTCPENRTVSCDYIYDLNNLDAAFDTLSIGESCGSYIVPTFTEDTNECGAGTLVRLFTAMSGPGPDAVELAHCKQVITLENGEPFTGEYLECPENEVTMEGCDQPTNFDPSITGVPTFIGGQCDLLGSDYHDQVFTFNNSQGDACFKILREWEIIDWCQIDPYTGSFYTWHCNQVIKISNSSRPVISGDQKVNVCSYDPDCSTADVELEAWGEDDCTNAENLKWSYRVYLGDLNGGPQNFDSPDSEGNGTGDHIVANGKYPYGNHLIRYTFHDGCGNSSTRDQEFTVANCKAATAYCINGLAVELMPIDSDNNGTIDFGMIELWAKDFDAGSSHPCYPVELSFSADPSDKNKTFDCTNIGNQIVEIWATVITPTDELVQTYCSTFIDIQDNMNSCLGLRVAVDGSIYTEDVQTVENVQVTLEGSPMQAMTNGEGDYAFPNMPAGGDYIVNPYNNSAPLNGVSTLDLITIQKHILGLEELSSPYKYIAADVDNNNEVNGVDLIELRKLILGIYSELPNNNSWRFVDKSYNFSNPGSPLSENYPENYEISNLASDMNIDFIAVKVGDVNNSAELNSPAIGRMASNASSNLEFEIENITMEEGEIIEIPISVGKSNQSISGFQLELSYDSDKLEIIELTGSDINQSNYVVKDGSIAMSWNTNENNPITSIELIAVAKSATDLTNVFSVKKSAISAEAYDNNGKILNPVIKVKGSTHTQKALIAQNNPNPFAESTEVQMHLSNDSRVNVTITDIEGRVVSENVNLYEAGTHVLEITNNVLGTAGIYYMTVMTNKQTQTIKMVLID